MIPLIKMILHVWVRHYLLGKRPRLAKYTTYLCYSAPKCRSVLIECECGFYLVKEYPNY